MRRLVLIFFALQAFVHGALAQTSEMHDRRAPMSYPVPGDMDCNGHVGLKDALLALQVSEKMNPSAICPSYADSGTDVNGDRKIGIQDAIYILQILSNTRLSNMVVNHIGMTFKLIPAGNFIMGSPTDEPGRWIGETQHQITLTKGFYMQTTEVTQGQWKMVMGSNPSYFSNCGDDCPVEQVSWNDVQGFISELNKLGEGNYRLPTEAEWEYAARAGSTTALANGVITVTGCEHDPNLHAIGWYCGNSGNTMHPVAQKQPNAWGLYDMHGNVWEWCQDWYGFYDTGPLTDPIGAPSGLYRVNRGGSWYHGAGLCRSASRGTDEPDNSYHCYGFRLVLPLGK